VRRSAGAHRILPVSLCHHVPILSSVAHRVWRRDELERARLWGRARPAVHGLSHIFAIEDPA